MEYSEEVLEHYFNPRNVGGLDEIDADVGAGVLGNPDCGLIMRLHIKVDEEKIIKNARFKAYGCGCTIASGSLLTELLIGKSLDEAGQIDSRSIAEKLKLPSNKMHCSILAEDALKKAIVNYLEKQQEHSDLETEPASSSVLVPESG
jgi:nitrogen fixation NifU-like protein